MSARFLITPFAAIALAGLLASPAVADDQPRGNERRRSPQASAPRDGGGDARGRGNYAQPRNERRDDRGREAWGGSDRGRPGPDASRGYDSSRRGDSRWGDRRDGRNGNYGRNDYGRNDYRGYDYRRYDRRDDRRTVVVVPRSYSRGWGYAAPRRYGYYPPTFRSWIRSDYYYSRPYYAFRPRLSIGFGVWVGYPVSLPSWGYAPFPVYGYPSGGYIDVTPSRAAYGAVSFEISPSYADLYVDGQLIGRVGDFTPNHPPLTLSPGSHQVEVVAEGYEPLAFEVHVVPGQVVPYRGEMRPY